MLSILLCTRNHSQWLRECIGNVLGQSFTDYEFIIRDDNSNDETPEILSFYKEKDRRISTFRHSSDDSLMCKYMDLVNRSSGEFLWLIASDDFAHDPDFLKKGFAALNSHSMLGGFFSNSRRVIAENSEWDGCWGWHGRARVLKDNTIIKDFLNNKLSIPGASAVLKRNALIELGGYEDSAGSLGDLLLNFRVAQKYGLWYLGSTAITVRVFKGGVSFGTKNTLEDYFAQWAFFEKILRLYPSKRDYNILWQNWNDQLLEQALSDFTHLGRDKVLSIYKENFSQFFILQRSFEPKESTFFSYLINKARLLRLRLIRSYKKRCDYFFVKKRFFKHNFEE